MHSSLKMFLSLGFLVSSVALIASPDGNGVGGSVKPKPGTVATPPPVVTPAPVTTPAPVVAPVEAAPMLERVSRYGYSQTSCKIFSDGRMVYRRVVDGLATEETHQLKFLGDAASKIAKLIPEVTSAAFVDRYEGRMSITSYNRQHRANGVVIDQYFGAIWQATRNSPQVKTLVHFLDTNCPQLQ